jgi:hypothetical protein
MMRIRISPIYTLVVLLPCFACFEDEESLDEFRAEAAYEDSLEIASDPDDPLEAIPVDPCYRSFRSIEDECIDDDDYYDPPRKPPRAPLPPPPPSSTPPRAIGGPTPQIGQPELGVTDDSSAE